GLVPVTGGLAHLYGGVVLPDYRHLYVIGTMQPRYGFGPLVTEGGGLLAMMIQLQDRMELPLGRVLKEIGQKPPASHLVNPAAAPGAARLAQRRSDCVLAMRALAGTVAVVTGAASGIGRALALRLAQEGCMLALGDVDAAGLAESAAAIRQIGVRVSTHQVDVSDAAAMEAFRDAVLREHGRVALLVNNAGVAIAGTVAELSLDDIAWLIGINFWGVVHGVKLFLPVLQQQYDAHIVNLSSIFGIVAPPGQAAYAASKFAVRGFSEALRHE